MQALKSERTSVTPEVVFSPAEQLLRIEGECYPENPLPFFTPLLATLGRYFEASQPARFVAEMKLQYINSASTMGLRSLFALLDQAGERGTDIRVVWAFDEEDDAIEELGADLVEDFSNLVLERQPCSS
ncbi:Domain of uncharacterised function (DUF1987) [Delftia tsuruhatensis]|uniref:DUF1987 domain-containing protein n=1 Tax=Delftia tsuruhatensis TaxID=180282 RepID=UPI001E7130A6|nr:DUF1987 domain-containing protein [Delftia tsuruhatensis]CAB5702571.1 Domain of uncharacterised function (DUF1987) [Delftia tsuruhatensis]CAC9691167.1 Domain of uncharacterised function (DUF1987) [Delftia tsuruhatensis]